MPHEIEEAARIDGCTRLQAFRFVIFPLVTPGIVTAGLFAWLLSWNEYLFALTLISTEALKTLPIRLNWYTNTGLAYELWGPMQAESVLYSLPVLVLFFVFQKYLAEGLTAGAVKG